MAKRYSGDAQARPDDYDAGTTFQAAERTFATFGAFCSALARLKSNECLIRGAVRAEAKADVEAGVYVRRLAYDREGEALAAFEPVARNWLVLDLDDSTSPFDPEYVQESIEFWRESLPTDLQHAQAAFFLSANAHRSETLRGKLVVALAEPLDNAGAEAWAKAHGFDGSVCRTVQPNYFAAPVFDGCVDPLAGKRQPWLLPGKPARLTAPAAQPKVPTKALASRDATPANVPPATDRAMALALQLANRWLDGGRVEGNAWLHLAGWLMGKDWPKAEVASLLDLLDSAEPDARKRAEHWHILGNAVAIDGPGGAREWLGDDFDVLDRELSRDPIADAYAKRAAERLRASRLSNDTDVDPWDDDTDFTGDDEPLEYACEGLRLAPSKGKISVIAGNAGGGKGPIANHLAVCFALGLPAFGKHACKQSRVLVIDYEGRRLSKLRMRRMARAMGRNPAELAGRVFHVDASTTGSALDPINLCAIQRRVECDAIDVVILDSYTTAMLGSGIDANSPQYAELAQNLGRLGVTVIAVAHAAKAHARDGAPHLSDIAGSGALGALAQTAIMVHYPDEANKMRIAVTCARAPETPFAPFELVFADTANDGLSVTVTATPEADDKPSAGIERLKAKLADASAGAEAIVRVLTEVDTLGAGMTPAKIRNALGMNQKSYGAALAEAQKRGTVVLASLPSDRDVRLRLASVAPRMAPAPLPKVGSVARKARASP